MAEQVQVEAGVCAGAIACRWPTQEVAKLLIRLRAFSHEFAEVHLHHILGAPAHGHYLLRLALVAQVRERAESSPPVLIQNIVATLSSGMSSEARLPVVRLVPHEPSLEIRSQANSTSRHFMLEGEMDRARIDALEHLRAGQELKWHIYFRALACESGQSTVVGEDAELPMPKSMWLDVLLKSGFQRTVQIEIPLRPGQRSHLARACSHLAKAQQSLAAGEAREAIGNCRDALEALSLHTGGDDSKAAFDGARELGKDGRLLVLRRALKLLPHAARHSDETAGAIEWTYADAEMVIAMTASFLRRYCA